MKSILTTGLAAVATAFCFAQPMVVEEWFRTVEGGSHRNDVAYRIVIGPDDSPVIAGDRTVVGRYTEPQMTVMKFSPDGDLMWNRYVSYGSGWSGNFVAMRIDQEGHPIITGNLPFVPEVRSNGALIEKLDPVTGVPVWATLYVNPRGLNGDEQARFLAIARNGDVLFSGQSHIDRDWMDLLALRLDRDDGRIK